MISLPREIRPRSSVNERERKRENRVTEEKTVSRSKEYLNVNLKRSLSAGNSSFPIRVAVNGKRIRGISYSPACDSVNSGFSINIGLTI